MIGSISPACVTLIHHTHDRPLTNHHYSLRFLVVFKHCILCNGLIGPQSEVVKALHSLVNLVPGHFGPLKKTKVTKDQTDQGLKWM